MGIIITSNEHMAFTGGTVVKNLPAKAEDRRDAGLIPGLGRSLGVRNGNPLKYSCLENSMDRAIWQASFSPWGCKESDRTEHIKFSTLFLSQVMLIFSFSIFQSWVFSSLCDDVVFWESVPLAWSILLRADMMNSSARRCLVGFFF